MVHVNVTKPNHFVFFRFSPDRGDDRTKRAEMSIAGEFSKIDRLADFLRPRLCRFLNCLESQLTLSGQRRHLATRATAHGARARAETMVDLFVYACFILVVHSISHFGISPYVG